MPALVIGNRSAANWECDGVRLVTIGFMHAVRPSGEAAMRCATKSTPSSSCCIRVAMSDIVSDPAALLS